MIHENTSRPDSNSFKVDHALLSGAIISGKLAIIT